MKEIKCPKCGSVFTVDEADYAAILNQVRNAEFERDLAARIHDMEQRAAAEQQARELQKRQEYVDAFNKERAKNAQQVADLNLEIERLRAESGRQLERLRAESTLELERLRTEVAGGEKQVAMARLEEQNRAKDALHERDSQIESLKLQIANAQNTARDREQQLKEGYELQLKQAHDTLEYYKDLKTRLSTKMVGETLEQHCSTQFNSLLRPILPSAYFDKDNAAADGSKGDFIFRDFDTDPVSGEPMEYISIMFEMKNEMDTTATKHRNTDFLDKLDRDRRAKKCEFAVLVSLLEADSELYNTGIVDMSHIHEKMYVIRPQFFIPLITLLVQTSRKTIDYQRRLAVAEQQTVDVANFEAKLEKFKDAFGRNFETAQKKYAKAIEEIDKSIKHLQDVRAALVGSEEALRRASGNTEELTIKRLTWGNKTMRDRFDAARNQDD